jgi:hypothetical protein
MGSAVREKWNGFRLAEQPFVTTFELNKRAVQNDLILIDDHEHQILFFKALAVDCSLAAKHLLKNTADGRIF